MSAVATNHLDMLNALREENVCSQTDTTITVWKDGSYKVWSRRDAEYGSIDPEFLVNIHLPVERDPVTYGVCTVNIEVGQRWRTPRDRIREILKINLKSVTYRETGGGNNFVNRSYKFDLWVKREGATLLANERKS